MTKSSITTLQAYSNADYASSCYVRRSTGGFAIYLGNNIIFWSTNKKPTVARSSTEAEYRDMANVIIELFWLQLLLKELGIKLAAASILWCDNIGATYLSCNPVFKARSKHIVLNMKV